MRIAQVCPYSLTVPGGVQAQAVGLARALRAQGHEARVLAPCDGPPPAAFVTPLGNSVPTFTNGSVAPLAPDPSCALRTIRALRDENFDVVHLHEPLAPGPTATALLFTDRPTVGTFHRAGASRAYAVAPRLARRAAGRLAARFAVSEDAKATAQAALGGTYEVLYNGVEVDRWATAPPWPTGGPTIFFVGRHEPRKGLAVLLEAMAYLPRATRLWVAGSGPQTAELCQATAFDHRVEWLGRIPEAEVASRLRGATVACFPSLHGESFGIVLLEAMAASTPVVASDLAGYRNVARAGRDALLVPPGDPIALADAVRRVLTDEVLAKELATSGDERAAEFSMDRLAARYLERYAPLVR